MVSCGENWTRDQDESIHVISHLGDVSLLGLTQPWCPLSSLCSNTGVFAGLKLRTLSVCAPVPPFLRDRPAGGHRTSLVLPGRSCHLPTHLSHPRPQTMVHVEPALTGRRELVHTRACGSPTPSEGLQACGCSAALRASPRTSRRTTWLRRLGPAVTSAPPLAPWEEAPPCLGPRSVCCVSAPPAPRTTSLACGPFAERRCYQPTHGLPEEQ